jgi:hypothetical protein
VKPSVVNFKQRAILFIPRQFLLHSLILSNGVLASCGACKYPAFVKRFKVDFHEVDDFDVKNH